MVKVAVVMAVKVVAAAVKAVNVMEVKVVAVKVTAVAVMAGAVMVEGRWVGGRMCSSLHQHSAFDYRNSPTPFTATRRGVVMRAAVVTPGAKMGNRSLARLAMSLA